MEKLANILFKTVIFLSKLALKLSWKAEIYHCGLDETDFEILVNQAPKIKSSVFVERLTSNTYKIYINTFKTFNADKSRKYQKISNNGNIIEVPSIICKNIEESGYELEDCLVVNDYSNYEQTDDKTVAHKELLLVVHLNFIKGKSVRFYYDSSFHNSHGFTLIVEVQN
jgi:hypothetical protein